MLLRLSLALILAVLLASSGLAQGVKLSLSSGSASPGTTVTLNITLNADPTDPPVALQWTLSFSPRDFLGAFTAATPSVTATKRISCNSATGSTTCVMWGLNATPISNGILATVSLPVMNPAAHDFSTVALGSGVAADAAALSLPMVTESAEVTILLPGPFLNGLSCNPVVVTAPAGTNCTVMLTGGAPGGGASIAMSSTNPAVTVAPVVVIPPGQNSATFAVTIGTVVSQTAVILSARYLGVSAQFVLTVNPSLSAPMAAAPVFSPPGGTYSSPQSVNISSPGASIRFTTDGSNPSEATGNFYIGPITIGSNVTLKAIAYGNGITDSPITSASYTIINSGPAWYDSAWTNRKTITINHNQVSGTTALSNFPVLFSATDSSLRTVGAGGGVGKPDGTDILFTASDGTTRLHHEMESYDPNTGQTIAWVQIPSLSPEVDTVIYVYFGNATAPDQQNPNGVWDSNYLGVWHFSNSATTSTNDSTSNGNNGVGTAIGPADGQIGGAVSFDGTLSQIDIDSVAGTLQTGDVTFSAWVKLASNFTNVSNSQVILRLGDDSSSNDVNLSLNESLTATEDGALHLLICSDGDHCYQVASDQTLWSAHIWFYVAGTYSATNGLRVYINGRLAGANPPNDRGSAYAAHAAIGAWSHGTAVDDFNFNGTIDEVRVSNIARSPDWIATEYNNQSSPALFLTLGALQTFVP